MPPKKRGQNVRGRDKIFRNAVQHVHVGIGHNVLGNLSLQSAAGFQSSTGDDECAFLLELNEQMLSHSSTDFKRFRWEVLELCESKALFNLNHRKIAQNLLLCLMRRDRNAEGYEAFVRLTVAFARDSREKFLSYFECFHQAVNGGILDAKGHFIADTRRLQLVFAAQAAWCREMGPFWTKQEHCKLVERIVRLYVQQMHDSKEYIRRLSAEVLAVVCRMVREVIPLVVREACIDVVQDFDDYSHSGEEDTLHRGEHADPNHDEEEEDEEEGEAKGVEDNALVARNHKLGRASVAIFLSQYEKQRLSTLPVVEGLSFLCAELLRGMRGSLNSHLEDHYALLIYSFQLSRVAQFQSLYSSGSGVGSTEMFGMDEKEAQSLLPSCRWNDVLDTADTVRHEAILQIAQLVGATTLGEALRNLMMETTKEGQGTSDEGDMNENEEIEMDAEYTGNEWETRPSHRLLSLVSVTCTFSVAHVRLLAYLLHSANGALLRDAAATPLLGRVTKSLLAGLCQSHVAYAKGQEEQSKLLAGCATVLEMTAPLCAGPHRVSESARRTLLPLCTKALEICTSTEDGSLRDKKAAALICFAFAQDVLQRHRAECLRHARVVAEEKGGLPSKSNALPRLPSFAVSLLATILNAACSDATSDAHKLQTFRQVSMLARMMDERVMNERSALRDVLRVESLGGLQELLLCVTDTVASSNDERWADILAALLPLVETIVSSMNKKDERAAFLGRLRHGIRRVMAAGVHHALIAQSAALLMQLSDRHSDDLLQQHSEIVKECANHLCRAVGLLVDGFNSTNPCEDGETARLLHGAECLVRFILRDGTLTTPLTELLDPAAQRGLVQTLLLESLASPVQSLRVLALRSLRTLCDPATRARVEGSGPVNTVVFDALLAAELFNPLSATGNLDGIRQALAKLSFEAAAGSIRDPLTRLIVGRAMIGLLHVRFADAWPIALKILSDLVRTEETKQQQTEMVTGVPFNALCVGENKEILHEDGNDDNGEYDDNKNENTTEDCTGDQEENLGSSTLRSRSRRKLLEPIVWTGVVCRYAREIVFGDVVRRARQTQMENDTDKDSDADSNEDADLHHHAGGYCKAAVPIWYHIHLTDAQRHEKGELVSKDFSSARYTSGTVALLDLANEDGVVLSWRTHYLPSTSPLHTHGAVNSRATDRAILAKTFLSGLADVARSAISHMDARARLVEELVLELAAVRRGEHPSGLRQLKSLDDRLVLAMQASCAAPTPAQRERQMRRIPSNTRVDIAERGERLKTVLVGLISDTNAKLQRAALDNLKRLKVLPFTRYHAQLVPYCDTQQNLFHFLASFHLETDVAKEDFPDYIATALAIALPKLTMRASKEKLKDQAILQRRVLSLLTHMTSSNDFTAVLEQLVQRLVFERVTPSTGCMDPMLFCFLSQWMEWFKSENHSVRRLERLLKQLQSTTQLLLVLLQAVGKGFAPFVGSCLHLALNAYLVSCRHLLRTNLDEESNSGVGHLLHSSALNALLPKLRRNAAILVAQLCEQFPEKVMLTLREDLNQVHGDVSKGLMGRYVAALVINSKGAARDVFAPDRIADGAQKSNTTLPLLRLVRAWVSSPFTMPLVGAYGEAVTTMFQQVFSLTSPSSSAPANSTSNAKSAVSQQQRLPQAAALTVYEGLRCVTSILAVGEEEILPFGKPIQKTETRGALVPTEEVRVPEKVNAKNKKRMEATVIPKKSTNKGTDSKTSARTLRALYIEPYVRNVFSALYRLIAQGQGTSDASGGKKSTAGTAAKRSSRASASSLSIFSVSMWKEMIATVTFLAEYIVTDTEKEEEEKEQDEKMDDIGTISNVSDMLSRLLEMCIAFVAHPACAKDRATCLAATEVLEKLIPRLQCVRRGVHFEPLVRLLNIVTSPEARLSLCRTLDIALPRIEAPFDASEVHISSDGVRHHSDCHFAQLAAVGRAVACMNSFAEDNEDLTQYDFDLRFHTFRTLERFFATDGTATLNPHHSSMKNVNVSGSKRVRRERDYGGKYDMTIPLDAVEAPVLCADGLLALAANLAFFLRDREGTIRAVAIPLLTAMLGYAARHGVRYKLYGEHVLESVVRRLLLSSLRRGVVSRDVHIRHTHMQCFGALAQYYPSSFPSFATIFSRNIEQSFFANVGHVQHRCRLNALAMLRRNVGQLLPRDVLRVFVPFLLSAVKDYAQGKRDLQNLTEGRAKGYCGAVLETLAVLAAALPWEGYYRVLSLLLMNARENVSLRLPMLRGVVMVLDHFTFLDDDGNEKRNHDDESFSSDEDDDDEEENDDNEEEDRDAKHDGDNEESHTDNDDNTSNKKKGKPSSNRAAAAAVVLRAKRIKYRHARVMHVLEDDILPQLYEFVGDGSRKGHPVNADLRGNAHSVTRVRTDMQKADKAQQNAAILQLPVAIAITKIVKRFPMDRFTVHAEYLLNEVVLKLRTKNDRQRESARRILSAMLCETGPGKLSFVLTKLKDNLVHGYQLHVLGYTVVTLLYKLYEPHHPISGGRRRPQENDKRTRATAINPSLDYSQDVEGNKGASRKLKKDEEEKDENDDRHDPDAEKNSEDAEEAELAQQLMPSLAFDHSYGVTCLTECLDVLMGIFLDDYLGEVGEQKEQVELMSTMVEVKRNRALQGFTLVASHCQAERVIETFLHKIRWLLTPPSDAVKTDVSELRGSARAAALLIQELKTKYSTISKNAAADLVFVQKVRLLAVRVARALMTNPTMQVESSFTTVRDLLQRHNEVREEKIRAFEAKDGTRRIRGNVHVTIQSAPRVTRKDQLDSNFLVAPRPERVDVDFNAHTVLATQQKQKLRVYKGRYGKEVEQAARDFYREDPTSAVVLDTLDEFLLKFLLSVLKQVLGVGKERKYNTAAVRLDLVRERRKQMGRSAENEDEEEQDDESNPDPESRSDGKEEGDDDDDDEEEANKNVKEKGEEEEEDGLDPQELDADEGDELDHLEDDPAEEHEESSLPPNSTRVSNSRHASSARRPMSDLTTAFTRQHQPLLESLIPIVLATLEGEGSDAVVGNALDCLLALVSLRPPLRAVGELHNALYRTVTAFFGRGGAIKQRAMRAAAAVVSHQRFALTEDQASQLTQLCHAELVERNEFVPMALSLFYAVLGKHVHVAEVYDLIGVVTELMMHMSAKRLLRQRCISVLVRFLTEYRMTPEKFRSHMDLLCRNLDYPEVTGRIALLELMDVLTFRLPTEVLRQEAPVVFLPLAVTLTAAEFREARQKSGDVMCNLVRNAGIDVVAPILAGWLAPEQKRPRKTMALQVWAILVPALAAVYGLSNGKQGNSHHTTQAGRQQENGDTAEEDESMNAERSEFEACCTWSLRAVLDAATYDQVAAAGTSRRHAELSVQARQKMELKGWDYVYYALRCVEGLVAASPKRMWHEVFAVGLLPCLWSRLIHHTHPWIQSVALRLLRLYCHDFVEQSCGYSSMVDWDSVQFNELSSETRVSLGTKTTSRDENNKKNRKKLKSKNETLVPTGETSTLSKVPTATSTTIRMPFVLHFFCNAGPADSISHALEVLNEMSLALKALLQYFGTSDVQNEKYMAHRAMRLPARADAVGAALYLTRAMAVISVALLATVSHTHVSSCRSAIAQHFGSLCRQLHALVTPLLRHGSVVNVMVRTTSLVQYMGGFLSAVPDITNETDEMESEHDHHHSKSAEAVKWLIRDAIGLPFFHHTVIPTLVVAMRCGEKSEKLSALGSQASTMIREQLEARRNCFTSNNMTANTSPIMEHGSHPYSKHTESNSASGAIGGHAKLSRTRGDAKKRLRDGLENGNAQSVSVDDVLFALTKELTAVRSSKREEVTKQDARKLLRKRQRSNGDLSAF